MSDVVRLTLRAPLERAIEADAITPDACAARSAREIAELPVWEGARRLSVGDLFEVRGERSARVRLEGDCARVDAVGAAMSTGELLVEGNIGRWAGTRMRGGSLRVSGSAGDGAGVEMAGGLIDIAGDAGDRVGASRLGASKGMLGGEIVVRGRVGAEAGARMRRGTIVCAAAGARAGEGMIAGSVIALGALGDDPGRYNKRGSLVALGGADVPRGYALDCVYHPPHLALTLRALHRRFGLPIAEAQVHGRYRRFSGDLAELGRGELLIWEGA